MNFEFLNANYFNTTTLASVTAGTTSVVNLIDKDVLKVWEGGTTGSINIGFSATKTVSRIVIQNTNLKTFKIHNGTTATTFTLTSTSDTTTTDWSQNSVTNIYLIFAATVSTLTIQIDYSATMDNANGYIGELWISDLNYRLPKNPVYTGYQPRLKPKEFVHEMSDGGITRYRISNKFQVDLRLQYYSATAVSSLKSIFDSGDSFIIVPYPTVTSWGSEIYQVNWVGPYDFLQPAGNTPNAHGFKGVMRLREVPS